MSTCSAPVPCTMRVVMGTLQVKSLSKLPSEWAKRIETGNFVSH